MNRLFPALLCPVIVAALLGGCDTKVDQCNKLINVVNKHTTTLSSSIEKLQTVEENPAVADEFAASVKSANDDIAALAFSDEKVAGFAKDYLALLAEADKVGKSMAEATKTNSADAREKAMADADKIVKLEDSIVTNVNAYCQGQ